MEFYLLALLILLGVGVTQGVSFMFGIYKSRSSFRYKLADKLLVLLTFVIVLECVKLIVLRSGIYLDYPLLTLLTLSHLQLFGPALYFFIRSKTDSSFRLKRIWFLVLIPYVIELIFHVGLISRLLKLEGQVLYQHMIEWQLGVPAFFIDISGSLSMIIYVTLAYQLSSKTKALKGENAWLNRLLILVGVNAIYLLVLSISDYSFFNYQLNPLYYRVSTFMFISVSYLIGIQHRIHRPTDLSASIFKQRSDKNELAEKELNEAKEFIADAVAREQQYLNQNLTQGNLAEELDISQKRLTEVLNRGFNKNFFDFINDYRLEYFISEYMKSENQDKTMIVVALTAGFSSKATFNRAFKKKFGVTPTTYFNELEKQTPTSLK